GRAGGWRAPGRRSGQHLARHAPGAGGGAPRAVERRGSQRSGPADRAPGRSAAVRPLLALLLLAAPGPGAAPPPPAELADAEAKAMLHVRQTFERIGRSSPVSDPALTQAARILARETLLESAEAASGARIGLAVSEAGGWDPNPTLLRIRNWPT